MIPPLFESLTGAPPIEVTPLVDYGYRAAWTVITRSGKYIVKADERPDLVTNEVMAIRNAATAGAPVPEFVGFGERPAPVVAFKWVPGSSLHGSTNIEAWQDAGRVLRRIHAAPPLRPRPVPWGEAMEGWFAAELGWMAERGFIETHEATAARAVAETLRPTLDATPLTWTHGDCQAEHFIIAPDSNEIAAVIDWADEHEGAPEMDFAVLGLFDPEMLRHAIDGYAPTAEFRQRLHTTLPLYQAIRAAGSLRWLETHGYPGHSWPVERVRALLK
ncbi:MAG: aminoglycoside phosphotransferase family protein [bacterium]